MLVLVLVLGWGMVPAGTGPERRFEPRRGPPSTPVLPRITTCTSGYPDVLAQRLMRIWMMTDQALYSIFFHF